MAPNATSAPDFAASKSVAPSAMASTSWPANSGMNRSETVAPTIASARPEPSQGWLRQ